MCCVIIIFFFKQKTAYEMRISDWSSDVCSSDLFGGEEILHRFLLHILARKLAETYALARHVARAGIGRHAQDEVAEIYRLAVMIVQASMVNHLQQYVEQGGMRLFDLVEHHHAMRLLVDLCGEPAALIITAIPRRPPAQTA